MCLERLPKWAPSITSSRDDGCQERSFNTTNPSLAQKSQGRMYSHSTVYWRLYTYHNSHMDGLRSICTFDNANIVLTAFKGSTGWRSSYVGGNYLLSSSIHPWSLGYISRLKNVHIELQDHGIQAYNVQRNLLWKLIYVTRLLCFFFTGWEIGKGKGDADIDVDGVRAWGATYVGPLAWFIIILSSRRPLWSKWIRTISANVLGQLMTLASWLLCIGRSDWAVSTRSPETNAERCWGHHFLPWIICACVYCFLI